MEQQRNRGKLSVVLHKTYRCEVLPPAVKMDQKGKVFEVEHTNLSGSDFSMGVASRTKRRRWEWCFPTPQGTCQLSLDGYFKCW